MGYFSRAIRRGGWFSHISAQPERLLSAGEDFLPRKAHASLLSHEYSRSLSRIAGIPEYPDSRIPGYPEIRISGFPDIRKIRKSGYPDIRVSGYPDIRIFGYPDIRISGYPDIRIFGYSDIRISGYPDFRICRVPYAIRLIRLTSTAKNC